MNYCIVAFGIILVISVAQWIVDGRKNYKGPYVDPEVLQQADLVGISTGQSHVDHDGVRGSASSPAAKDRADKED
jgi:hypothetical protein